MTSSNASDREPGEYRFLLFEGLKGGFKVEVAEFGVEEEPEGTGGEGRCVEKVLVVLVFKAVVVVEAVLVTAAYAGKLTVLLATVEAVVVLSLSLF